MSRADEQSLRGARFGAALMLPADKAGNGSLIHKVVPASNGEARDVHFVEVQRAVFGLPVFVIRRVGRPFGQHAQKAPALRHAPEEFGTQQQRVGAPAPGGVESAARASHRTPLSRAAKQAPLSWVAETAVLLSSLPSAAPSLFSLSLLLQMQMAGAREHQP